MADITFGDSAQIRGGSHNSRSASTSTTEHAVRREVAAKAKQKSAGKRAVPFDDYIDVALKRRALSAPPIDPTLDPQPPSESAAHEAWPGRAIQEKVHSVVQIPDQQPSYPPPSAFRYPYSATHDMTISDPACDFDPNTTHQLTRSSQSLDAARVDQDTVQRMNMDPMTGQPIMQQSFHGLHHQQSSSRQVGSQAVGSVQRLQDGVDTRDEHEDRAAHDAGTYSQPDVNPPGSVSFRYVDAGNLPPAPGFLTCDCCPKKPKKFDNEEDLRLHEMEKQYMCQYCHNRFKNKNEAERHQNSLHLRKHSWSCSLLTTFEMAFHPTPNATAAANSHLAAPYNSTYASPTISDTCGYCGSEFPNPPDWDARIEHLNNVHKFGECNQSKKFFRADHFRQHLKHSHAGTSGKWTNMLETACVRDEPPPQPLHQMAAAATAQGMQGMALQGPVQMAGLAAGQSLGPVHVQHGLPPQSPLASPQQSLPPQQSHHQSHSHQQQQQEQQEQQPPPPPPPLQRSPPAYTQHQQTQPQTQHPPTLQQMHVSQRQHVSSSTKDDPT